MPGRAAEEVLRRPLGHDFGARAVGDQRHDELVPAHAVGDVGAEARTGAQHRPQQAQRLVAHRVPAVVVDVLELVDVHVEQRNRHLDALRELERPRQVALQRAAVAEAGQRVGEGQPLELGQVARGGALLAADEGDDPPPQHQREPRDGELAFDLAGPVRPAAVHVVADQPWDRRHQQDEDRRKDEQPVRGDAAGRVVVRTHGSLAAGPSRCGDRTHRGAPGIGRREASIGPAPDAVNARGARGMRSPRAAWRRGRAAWAAVPRPRQTC